MAPRIRKHVEGPGPGAGDDLIPRHLSRQAFGQRLEKLMVRRGWRQADLARHSGLKRDAISTYVTGKVFPIPQNLAKVAKALGVTPEELLPNHVESAIEADNPSVEIKSSTSSPNKAWLRVNRLVHLRTALEVAQILEKDDVTDRD